MRDRGRKEGESPEREGERNMSLMKETGVIFSPVPDQKYNKNITLV